MRRRLLIAGPRALRCRLRLIASIRGAADIGELSGLLEEVGLDPADRRRYGKYSLGMKQRLGMAAAVMGAPDLIVLDEPTNALDASGVEMVSALVRRERARGAAIVMASHDPRVLKILSDEVRYLAEGHLDGYELGEAGGSHA